MKKDNSENNSERTRIAFQVKPTDTWTAGTIYFENLLYSLKQTLQRNRPDLFLLINSGPQDLFNINLDLTAVETIIRYTPYRKLSPLRIMNLLNKLFFSRDFSVEKVLRKHGVNVVFGFKLNYRYPGGATLSWLPDFQHIRLPEMFSPWERFWRSKQFLHSIRGATFVILPTEAAKKDFCLLASAYLYKVKVMHPISNIPQSIYDKEPKFILKIYNIPEKFVYLPNQFWKHKNHETAFQAVKVLKDRGLKINLVCTGNPSDYRHPDYFRILFRKVSDMGIQDQIKYLGLIPHEHVLLLMRQSVCMLNPSFFEGWGITLDEARSLGKKVLVSNVSAHQEQNAPAATYFDPQNIEELADKLDEIWKMTDPGPDSALEEKARKELPLRMEFFAETFLSVVKEGVAKSKKQ